ncbi:hypothetical protein [Paraburkholderia hospita]|uniref:hypothetical protein n=1 Tax=Paraburkholderia hospita TaxID=169430 RepID=UPI0039BE4350
MAIPPAYQDVWICPDTHLPSRSGTVQSFSSTPSRERRPIANSDTGSAISVIVHVDAVGQHRIGGGGSPRAAKTGPSGDATRRRGRESVEKSSLAWCAEGARRSTDAQIEVSPDDPTTQVTPARDSTPVQCNRYRLTVRAKAGKLGVVAAWQVLGFEASRANQVGIRVDRRTATKK